MNRRLMSIIIIAVGMIAGAVLVSNQQDINKDASLVTDKGEISLEPIYSSQDPNSMEKLELSFSTGLKNEKPTQISTISIRLQYPGDISGAIQSNEEGPFVRSEELDENWQFVVNDVTFEDGVTQMDLAAVYIGTEGFGADMQSLATLNFRANMFTKEDYAVLGWKEDNIKMLTKEIPIEDVLQDVNKKQVK